MSGYQLHSKSPGQLGELAALDIRTGEKKWSQHRRAPYTTEILTTGGGLVFAGTWDRYMVAYDASTGAARWQTRLPTMANGFPITYSVGGTQYVAFGSGASISGSSWAVRVPAALTPDLRNPGAGNGLYVFALPDSSR